MQLAVSVFALTAASTGVLAEPNDQLEERGELVPSSLRNAV